MKSEFSTSWVPIQKSSTARHQTELHQSNSHQLPPSSPLLTPRTAAGHRANSFAASFRSVFQRTPQRATSASSLHSAYSGNSSAKPPSYTTSDNASLHPYAAMVAAPLPVVSSHDTSDDEDECPVCLEPLSSSFRLPGEKPHIVPECGHALHEVSYLSRHSFSCPPPPYPCPCASSRYLARFPWAGVPLYLAPPCHSHVDCLPHSPLYLAPPCCTAYVDPGMVPALPVRVSFVSVLHCTILVVRGYVISSVQREHSR